jgi:NET1-associated nuclear protein 1 (U3 small nucleolar RNA-associated protein 17)
LDTGKPQFLPHLSATVQNIVVSPTGTSYAVRLADNSAMVLSTAELKPTLYISGIQAQVFSVSGSLEPRVARIKDEERKDSLAQRIPASINPALPSTLLLAVGETQEIDPASKQILSNPYLQTFDIGSDHTVSRQALTRTNVTNVNVAPKAHRISEPRVTQMQTSHDGRWLATVDEWLPPRSDVEFLGHSTIDLSKEQHARREIYLKFWQWSNTNAKWELISRIDAPHAMDSGDSGAGRVFELIANPSSTTFSTIGEDGFVRIWHPRTRTRDGVIVRGKDGEALVNWGCHAAISLGSATLNVDAIDIADDNSQRPEHGCLAFSEDGSVLAAAMTSSSNGLIHLIDPFFGTIKFSRPLTYRGNVLRMVIVSQCLVVLSDDLRVYDLVQDELQYGITLGQKQQSLSLEQKVEMMHLSVDCASKTFAVCLPGKKQSKGDKAASESLVSAFSEIAIFEAHRPDPVMLQMLPHLVTALVPALGSPGYVVLDTAAEITTISPNANQAASEIETFKPIADLPVHDTGAEEPELDLMQLIQEAQEKDEEMSYISIEANDAATDDGGGPPVVSQQALANTFEAGPFALPPIEEMFYQVANLLSHRPATRVVQ